jgi:hypothetical protein
MFTKLKAVALLICLFVILIFTFMMGRYSKDDAVGSDEMNSFASPQAAKSWFSNRYRTHEFHEKNMGSYTIYSFYGGKGSGVRRVDAYFYGCGSDGCALIAMKMGTPAGQFNEAATVEVKNSRLTIESKNNFKFEFDVE